MRILLAAFLANLVLSPTLSASHNNGSENDEPTSRIYPVLLPSEFPPIPIEAVLRWSPESTPSNLVYAFTHLRHLTLGDQLKSIPEEVSDLESLRSLTLSIHNFEALPESLTRLRNLERLKLTNATVGTIPDFLKKFKKLTLLSFLNSVMNFETPKAGADFFNHFPNLTTLELGQQSKTFPVVPTSIHTLKELEILTITSEMCEHSFPGIKCQTDMSHVLLRGPLLEDAFQLLETYADLGIKTNEFAPGNSIIESSNNLPTNRLLSLEISRHQLTFAIRYPSFSHLKRLVLSNVRRVSPVDILP